MSGPEKTHQTTNHQPYPADTENKENTLLSPNYSAKKVGRGMDNRAVESIEF